MTDEITGMTPDEEPTQAGGPEASMPTIDDMATVTMAPAESLAHMVPTEPTAPLAYMAPTEQIVPQAMPAQAYDQYGAMGGAAPQFTYPNMAQTAPQPGYPLDPYGQSAYAPFPGQPGQPFPGQPDVQVPARKKRPVVLLVAIALIVVLLIGGGTAFAVMQANASTPTKTLQKYCDGFMKHNAQEMYDTYSAASKQATNIDQVQQGFSMLQGFTSFMKLSGCTVSDVQQNGSTATGKVTIAASISFGDISTTVSLPLVMKLVLESNEWKIDASGTTMPQFTMPTIPALPTFPPDFLTPTVSQ